MDLIELKNKGLNVIDSLVTSDFTRQELIAICSDLDSTPKECIPLNDYCKSFLMSYFAVNISSIEYTILSHKVWDDDIRVLRWFKDNLGPYHVFLKSEDCVSFIATIAAIESGAVLELPTMNELAKESEFNTYMRYFAHLHFVELEHKEIIPSLSDTFSIDESTARFSDAIWFEKVKEKTVVLAGLGGIGSYVAFLLSRVKPGSIWLYDDDVVERVNLAGQLYSNESIGRSKVNATAHLLDIFSSYNEVYAIDEKYEEASGAEDIMICGFDNMKARKVFFNNWLNHLNEDNAKDSLFIDGRLAAEQLQVFCIRGDDLYSIERYKNKYLFDDSEADATTCSYKQTTFMANMIGSIIVNLFVNFTANQIVENLRDLPFYTSYDAELMTFKTES